MIKEALVMSWYVKGNDKEKREQMRKEAHEATVMRFWLKKDESADIIFLDDEPFCVHEYTVKINNQFKQYTCSGDDSPMSVAGVRKTYVEYYNVLDLRKYTNREGKEVSYTRKALPVKGDAIDILNRRREECKGSLKFVKFKVSRFGDKSVNCGNDWQIQGKVPESKIPQDDKVRRYRFEEVLAPPSEQKQEAILRAIGKDSGSADDNSFSRNDFSSSGFESQGFPAEQNTGGNAPTFDPNEEVPF
jgi:hypothetical protein